MGILIYVHMLFGTPSFKRWNPIPPSGVYAWFSAWLSIKRMWVKHSVDLWDSFTQDTPSSLCSLCWITCSEGRQLPWWENSPEAIRRELWTVWWATEASSQKTVKNWGLLPTSMRVNLKWILWPRLSLQISTTLIDTLTATLQEILNQTHEKCEMKSVYCFKPLKWEKIKVSSDSQWTVCLFLFISCVHLYSDQHSLSLLLLYFIFFMLLNKNE